MPSHSAPLDSLSAPTYEQRLQAVRTCAAALVLRLETDVHDATLGRTRRYQIPGNASRDPLYFNTLGEVAAYLGTLEYQAEQDAQPATKK